MNGGVGGAGGGAQLSIAYSQDPCQVKKVREAQKLSTCRAQQSTPTRKLVAMSLDERLSKIRDNPKLQGQQQVRFTFVSSFSPLLRGPPLTFADPCLALGHRRYAPPAKL